MSFNYLTCNFHHKHLSTEHWNISESEEEHQENNKDSESEFTTDSEDESDGGDGK